MPRCFNPLVIGSIFQTPAGELFKVSYSGMFQSPSNRVNIPNRFTCPTLVYSNRGFNPLVIGSIFQTERRVSSTTALRQCFNPLVIGSIFQTISATSFTRAECIRCFNPLVIGSIFQTMILASPEHAQAQAVSIP